MFNDCLLLKYRYRITRYMQYSHNHIHTAQTMSQSISVYSEYARHVHRLSPRQPAASAAARSIRWCSFMSHKVTLYNSYRLPIHPPKSWPKNYGLSLILQICPNRFLFITKCTIGLLLFYCHLVLHRNICNLLLPIGNISSQKPRSTACSSPSASTFHIHTVQHSQVMTSFTWPSPEMCTVKTWTRSGKNAHTQQKAFRQQRWVEDQ